MYVRNNVNCVLDKLGPISKISHYVYANISKKVFQIFQNKNYLTTQIAIFNLCWKAGHASREP